MSSGNSFPGTDSTNTVHRGTAFGAQMDLLVAGLGGPFGHRYLGARNSKRHVNLAGSGFIENVAHLIMKCGEFRPGFVTAT